MVSWKSALDLNH